ncbi:HAD-IA family hydrolase [Candidatus Saccharibacteria bacterium]|nr:HAD-IA family hydrolase [Candidatus Saccharibacteria bacterium]
MNTAIKVVLLDYGRIVAPEDGAPVTQTVYGAPPQDKTAAKIFGSLRHDLAAGKVDEDDIKSLLINEGYIIPNDYEERWRHTIENHLRPTSEMINLIETLKLNHYTVALLSNVWPLSAKIIASNGWYDHFDKIYLSCDMHLAKPDTMIYDTVLADLAVSPDSVLFIDDKLVNLNYPRELGMQTLHADNPDDAATKITQFLKLQSPK